MEKGWTSYCGVATKKLRCFLEGYVIRHAGVQMGLPLPGVMNEKTRVASFGTLFHARWSLGDDMVVCEKHCLTSGQNLNSYSFPKEQ